MLAIEQLGKYEIVEQIGEGGFGSVWRGRDPLLKRMVAIKTCDSEDEELRQRFLREAEIAGSLHHPNVVVVHDFGFEAGVPYLVQEFLSGEDLSKVIGRGELVPLATKLRWLADVSRGLEYAHCHGVVHRDVKPSNVRILEDGSAKVMDFGIAKLAEADTQHLTKTGTAIGTVGYMAPEQLKGDPIGFPADMFSFGVLAYELLTYRRPFDGETVSRMFYQILNEDPPLPTTLAEDVPPELERIVLRCLAKLPEQRYGSFHTILRDLERVAAGEPLDLDSTGDVTTDLGPTIGSSRVVRSKPLPDAEPAAEPTKLLLQPPARRAPRNSFVVAGVITLLLGLFYLFSGAPEPPPATPAAKAPTVAAAQAVDTAPVEANAPTPGKPSPRSPERPSPPAPAKPPSPSSSPTPPSAAGAPVAGAEVPPAGPAEVELTKAGPGVVLPQILKRPPLRYPRLALRARHEGVVAVAVLVDEAGQVSEVRKLGSESGFGLDEATAEYARRCQWAAGTEEGVASPMWYELRVRYSLPDRR